MNSNYLIMPSDFATAEIEAVQTENIARMALKIPLRTTYNWYSIINYGPQYSPLSLGYWPSPDKLK